MKDEKSVMVNLPPINENCPGTSPKLLDVMKDRVNFESQYLHTKLCAPVENIKIVWYEN